MPENSRTTGSESSTARSESQRSTNTRLGVVYVILGSGIYDVKMQIKSKIGKVNYARGAAV